MSSMPAHIFARLNLIWMSVNWAKWFDKFCLSHSPPLEPHPTRFCSCMIKVSKDDPFERPGERQFIQR